VDQALAQLVDTSFQA